MDYLNNNTCDTALLGFNPGTLGQQMRVEAD